MWVRNLQTGMDWEVDAKHGTYLIGTEDYEEVADPSPAPRPEREPERTQTAVATVPRNRRRHGR